MSVARPALLPLIFIEKAIARFGYVRAMAFVVKNIEPFPPPCDLTAAGEAGCGYGVWNLVELQEVQDIADVF